MYITKREELRRLIEERKGRRAEILKRLEKWAEGGYGIPFFGDMVRRHFEPAFTQYFEERTAGILARQVPSIMIEDVACFIFSQALGLRPVALSLLRDAFTDKNPDKVRRVNLPWASWSNSGHLVRRYERIVAFDNRALEGKVLRGITTKDGNYLSEYHRLLRERVFGMRYDLHDASAFHVECLLKARILPEYVWRETRLGYEEKVYRSQIKAADFPYLRPPAEWYYPLYLSLFLDGRMVLLETYENPEASVPYARLLFEKTMRRLEREVGFRPLVVEILPLSKELMDYNRHLLEQPFPLEEILQITRSEEDLVRMYEKITRKVITFGRKGGGE